jgi:hypothetical protein
MNTTKSKIESLLRKLPNECSVEDIHYHLYVFQKVYEGLKLADTEGRLQQDEAENILSKWLIE